MHTQFDLHGHTDLWSMSGSKEIFSKKYRVTLYTFYPKLSPLGVEGHKFRISCLFTLQMLHTKFGKDWPYSFWEEEYVDGWGTPTHSNRSPKWLKNIIHLVIPIPLMSSSVISSSSISKWYFSSSFSSTSIFLEPEMMQHFEINHISIQNERSSSWD